MSLVEENSLVRQLCHSIIGALSVEERLTPLYPAQLSLSLREAVCAKGLCRQTNMELLHVIEQLAGFRAGTKTCNEFRFALEKRVELPENPPGVKVCSNQHRSGQVIT